MAHLYADEDFDLPIVIELRRLGHNVLTIFEAGQGNRKTPDEAVLAFGAAQGRAVLTFNRRHYIRLHRQSPAHAGIIVCADDRGTAALAARIHEALSNCPNLASQLIRITRPHRP